MAGKYDKQCKGIESFIDPALAPSVSLWDNRHAEDGFFGVRVRLKIGGAPWISTICAVNEAELSVADESMLETIAKDAVFSAEIKAKNWPVQ